MTTDAWYTVQYEYNTKPRPSSSLLRHVPSRDFLLIQAPSEEVALEAAESYLHSPSFTEKYHVPYIKATKATPYLSADAVSTFSSKYKGHLIINDKGENMTPVQSKITEDEDVSTDDGGATPMDASSYTKTTIQQMLREDLKAEYTAIAQYELHIEQLKYLDGDLASKILGVLQSLREEEMVHVGELQEVLSTVEPMEAQSISKGEQEAAMKMNESKTRLYEGSKYEIERLAKSLGILKVVNSSESSPWVSSTVKGLPNQGNYSYFGYSTITTVALGEFVISYRLQHSGDGLLIPLDGSPWEFLKKIKLTAAQREFVRENTEDLWTLLKTVRTRWSIEDSGSGGDATVTYEGQVYYTDDSNGKRIWNSLLSILENSSYITPSDSSVDKSFSSSKSVLKHGDPNAELVLEDPPVNLYVYAYRSADLDSSYKNFVVYLEAPSTYSKLISEITSLVSGYEGWVVQGAKINESKTLRGSVKGLFESGAATPASNLKGGSKKPLKTLGESSGAYPYKNHVIVLDKDAGEYSVLSLQDWYDGRAPKKIGIKSYNAAKSYIDRISKPTKSISEGTGSYGGTQSYPNAFRVSSKIPDLRKYLKETPEDELVIRTTYVSGGWHDVEFDANRAGFSITRYQDADYEKLHQFAECYYLKRVKAKAPIQEGTDTPYTVEYKENGTTKYANVTAKDDKDAIDIFNKSLEGTPRKVQNVSVVVQDLEESTHSEFSPNQYSKSYKIGDKVRAVHSGQRRSPEVAVITGYDRDGFYTVEWSDGEISQGLGDPNLRLAYKKPVRESTTPKHYTDDEKKDIFQRFSNSEYCKKSPAGPPLYSYKAYRDEVYAIWDKFLQEDESSEILHDLEEFNLHGDIHVSVEYEDGFKTTFHDETEAACIVQADRLTDTHGKITWYSEVADSDLDEATDPSDNQQVRESISKVFKPTTK